ncbi:MAG: hypothetical protein PVH03_08470 [Chloroflexota bacterium]|jgi:hypothetical protein
MSDHKITLRLPEDLYQQLRRKAELSKLALSEVALQSLRAGMPPSLDQVPERFHADLQELDQMSAEMLWQIAQADLPDEKAVLYESLLERNQNDELQPAEQEALETLREETDLLMLRRAYAYTLLKWRGYRIPALSELISS